MPSQVVHQNHSQLWICSLYHMCVCTLHSTCLNQSCTSSCIPSHHHHYDVKYSRWDRVRRRKTEATNLNLSEGLNRRLNANEAAFEGREMVGMKDNASSCMKKYGEEGYSLKCVPFYKLLYKTHEKKKAEKKSLQKFKPYKHILASTLHLCIEQNKHHS